MSRLKRIFSGKTNKRVVLALSDIHSGYVLGLLNPHTVLIREGEDGEDVEWMPDMTRWQEKLWPIYQENIDRAHELSATEQAALVAFHLGDATQGDKYNKTIPDTDREDQRTIAYYNLLPVAEIPALKAMRLATGTPVHVPDCAEARIAHRLRQNTDRDVRSYHQQRISICGSIFDLGHHGPHTGSRDWLIGNVATYYLRDRIYRDRRRGKRPADVYLRGHYHRFVWVTLNDTWEGVTRTHHLIIVPSFAGPTDYWRKVGKTDPTLDVGMVAFVIEDGNIAIHDWHETIDLQVEEEL